MSYLTSDYLNKRTETYLRGHKLNDNSMYKSDFKNASEEIVSFLSRTILSQAKHQREAYLYNLSAEKCFNNNTNNYSVSEALECEKLIFQKDPILHNIKSFTEHVKIDLQDKYEKKLVNIECAAEYETKHKEFLLESNYLNRYYYYFMAKGLFYDK